MRQLLSEEISIDDKLDTLTINGVTMSGDFVRFWTEPTPYGVWFRITEKRDGMVVIEKRTFEVTQ
jgi:hypothetical protein